MSTFASLVVVNVPGMLSVIVALEPMAPLPLSMRAMKELACTLLHPG